MPDGPDLSQNTQLAPPPPTQGMPMGGQRPGMPPAGPPPQAPPAPAQDPNVTHHALIGRAVSALMGHTVNYSINPETGQTVATPQKQTPGQWGRSMVLGAMLGLAAGSDGEAKGGSVGGFMGGFGKGGAAVAQRGEQQDALKRQQAEQQYKNEMEAQKNKRENDAANSEEMNRQANRTLANLQTLHTQQLINRDNSADKHARFAAEAERGQAKLDPYEKVAGLGYAARNVTEEEHTAILKANPKAMNWDWEQTGVKTVVTKDKDGNEYSDYVPVYSAIDHKGPVTLGKPFYDLLKQSNIDAYFPHTTDTLSPDSTMSADDYILLKAHYQKAYNDKLAKDESTMTLNEKQSVIDKNNAEAREANNKAARTAQATKASEQLGASLTAWNKQTEDLLKTNKNATPEDSFKLLKPGDQLLIGDRLQNRINALEKEIIDAHNAGEQDRADTLKGEQEEYKRVQSHVFRGAPTVSVAPTKPSKPDTVLPGDMAQRYLDAAGGDADKARANAKKDGWVIPGASGGIVQGVKNATKAIQGAVRSVVHPEQADSQPGPI